MYSNLVPFEEIIEDVKDDTGITSLANFYPKIRRLVYRVEKDIGFGSTVILKKMTFSVLDNTIRITNGKYSIKLPEDILYLEEVGMCSEGICPGDYVIQGNYLFFCKPVRKFTLIYYTMLCDGKGNPVVSENHREAVASGVAYYLYKPKRFNDKGSRAVLQELQVYYEDRVGEARGDDVMPSTESEWKQMAGLMNMSARDLMLYSSDKRCFCSVPNSLNPDSNTDGGTNPNINSMVYFWQFTDLSTDINFAQFITQSFLDQQRQSTLESFGDGFIVDYENIGRIAFAISKVLENTLKITDVFESDITDIVFDTFYDIENNIQYYISKEYYSHSNIYFKITPN